jgi:DNA-binding NtrC family response regulator
VPLRILLVEDDADVREAVLSSLSDEGHSVTAVIDGAAAMDKIAEDRFDVVITDIRLPKADGLAVFDHARRVSPRTDVILMTSFGGVAEAVSALKKGAHDYLTKPFDVDELVIRVASIASKRALQRELDEARATLAGSADGAIVGAAPAMRKLFERLHTVAASDAPVLVTGESGTGKELVARSLHARSARATKPFVAVNCAAFPETLLEAELFGHERGAFTGAAKKRDGRFKAADGGTLMLDEIAEMPLPAQAKLLRVLQDGVVEPLGTNTSIRVDVRIVSATHRDLKRRIAEGAFREDLYYRLNVVGLHIPPLRERPGDLPLLLQLFLRYYLPSGAPIPDVTVRAWQALSTYPFLGNVRELAHAVQHAVVLSRGQTIDLEHLPDDITRVATTTTAEGDAVKPLAVVIKQAEREHLLRALAIAGGRRTRAAELLGISRKNLWEKLRAQGISDSDVDDALLHAEERRLRLRRQLSGLRSARKREPERRAAAQRRARADAAAVRFAEPLHRREPEPQARLGHPFGAHVRLEDGGLHPLREAGSRVLDLDAHVGSVVADADGDAT